MRIGIDLGGSHIGIGIVNSKGNIISKIDIDIVTKNITNMKEFILDTIVTNIKELLVKNKIELAEIELIGIGVPGEPKDGIIKRLVNLGIENFNIVEKLKKSLNFENIIIKNDGKCAAIAEKLYGSMKEYDDAVFLCLGTGIGGACFINNKLLKPKKYSGFEFGHMIINKHGEECKCGNKGCFETYCSMKRLKDKLIENLNLNSINSKELLEHLKKNMGNEEVQKIIKEYNENLIIGLSNITNILEPECITLGGGFVYFQEVLLNGVIEEFKRSKYLFNKENIPVITLAKLGNDAGIIGSTIDINQN